ncbi:hypothetical protein DFJ58DRAFT_840183 [Suillus subalutaceus]|uniref:uncharacterized protein n=1 Tax=Suillus subalutaceus TaxID=48586 RepID=UPI001B863B41|nr:uncharacterized protein DFJ58DRAFT_840183 [Suillus subalutaceus]KAG1859310.1 hypothetical protein DFJ58DRAFT_840183 [Suillus subalutaceus]
MGGSKVQEWTPTRNISVVEWKKIFQSRKVTGEWVERPKIQKIQSVSATPTKSSSKQPSQNMLYDGGDEFIGDLHQQDFIPLQLPKSLSQNDYLRQWVPKTQQYLNILLGMEHQRLPFHQISQWTGGFFEDCCLVKTGADSEHANDNVGPKQYPKDSNNGNNAYDAELDEQPTGVQYSNDINDLPTGVLFIKNHKTMTTIVDKSGVHTHIIKYCTCADAPSTNIQLFQMGMFPASFSQPKTAFTFDVLDDFLLDNLECGTSAMNYYSKLRRMTTACPQPGINVTLLTEGDYEETNNKSDLETPSWLHSRSLVMNGNFKAEYLHAANPIDEVSLMDGYSFMPTHLTTNWKQWASGVVPVQDMAASSLVQWWTFRREKALQTATRQMNMNYTLCEGLKHNADGIQRALTFYDVNCQYHKHLKDCIADNPFLDIRPELEIIPGIGLTARSWVLQTRMVLTYGYSIRVIGQGWFKASAYAEVQWFTKTRQGECPWLESSFRRLKIGGLKQRKFQDYEGKALCRKFRQVVKGVADSKVAFEKLDQTADANQVREWEQQEKLAQQRHATDPKAMDIYEVRLQKDSANKKATGTTVAGDGLSIKEAQVTLQMDVWKLNRHSIQNQQLEIGCRRERMQGDIDHWVEFTVIFLGDALYDSDIQVMEDELLILEEDFDDDMTDQFTLFDSEKVVIPMPSNLGTGRCTERGSKDLIHQELVLRQGQANDALHNIRVHLADKAIIFHKTVRMAKSQAMYTRALALVHSVDRTRYRPLAKEHLKVSTAISDPNTRGQRNNILAWFWSMDMVGDSDGSDWLNEFYRVHWLHAKALRDRWEEEMLLVQHEMNWTCNFFVHKANQWIRLGILGKDTKKVGHIAYAVWQCVTN